LDKERASEFNLKIGHTLSQMRQQAGLSIEGVLAKTQNQQLRTLSEIEFGKRSISCCELYELLQIYSPSQEHILFFCMIPFKGLSYGNH
jgi:transcriptional regulator with XRE-family HTH domain